MNEDTGPGIDTLTRIDVIRFRKQVLDMDGEPTKPIRLPLPGAFTDDDETSAIAFEPVQFGRFDRFPSAFSENDLTPTVPYCGLLRKRRH